MKRASLAPPVLALSFATAGALVGQTPPDVLEGRRTLIEVASLEGQIVDSISGDPIEGVLVRMDSGQEAFSDVTGSFSIDELPPGRRLFALLTSDCRITWGQVDMIAGIPRVVRLRLPPAFGAAAEEAQREVEQRKRTGGRRLEAHEIDVLGARSVTELIRRLAPGMVRGMSGAPGASSPISSGRTRSFVADDAPVVVIDGLRIPDPEITLDTMQPSEVEVLEVLPGAAAGWEYGSSGAGGVIKITLRRPLATGAQERRVAAPCVVPEFPRG